MPLIGDTLLFTSVGMVGFLAGIFITLLFAHRRKPEKEPESRPPAIEPAVINQPEAAPTPAPPTVMPPHPQAEVHLWRDPASGKVKAEVDGIEFSSVHTMNPEQRRKLVSVLREGAAWLNTSAPKPVSARSEAQPALAARPAPLAAQPGRAAAAMPPKKTGSFPSSPGEKPPDANKTAPVSIVAQIDAILQDMLADSPLKTRGIRLVEDQAGSVTVWVGVTRYPGIDAVTDAEALAVIRAAVAQWERQSVG